MEYGNSWRNFKGANWPYFPSPQSFSGGYQFSPFENHRSAYGPQRSPFHFNHPREFAHPVSHFGSSRRNPYTLPAQYHPPQRPESYFITPNAGMVENQKLCKSDEHPFSRHRDEFENFSSQDKAITIDVKCQSTVCTVNWSMSSRFSSAHYYVIVELYLNDRSIEQLRREIRPSSCQFQTTPGYEYEVEVRLISRSDKNRTAQLIQRKAFKAIFSKSEINELYNLCVQSVGKEALQRFIYLYRVKPSVYFDDIEYRTNNVMEKYIKDDNGHASSPINGEIRGLFFSGQLFHGRFPPKSPFGDKLFYINPNVLFSPENTNLYFADFYCTGKPHYVTVVLCKKNLPTDIYCKNHIKALNFFDNPFLRAEAVSNEGQIEYNYYVNNNVHVEICYTEDVCLEMGYFERVDPAGIGSSRIGGLRNNVSCTVCNLKRDNNLLLPSTEKIVQASTDTKEEKKTPTLQKQNSNESSSERKSSAQNEATVEKQQKVEPSKPSILIELLKKDRSQRNCPDFSEEISSLVSDLVEEVGTNIDLENFQRKIREGVLDESLLDQNFLEMETKL